MHEFDLLTHLTTILVHLNLLIEITGKTELKEIRELLIQLTKDN